MSKNKKQNNFKFNTYWLYAIIIGIFLIFQLPYYFSSSDISSFLMENAFEFLDAPVKRVGSLNTPIPFADSLERQYLANLNFENSLKALIEF